MLIAAFIACQAPKQQEIQAAVVSARIELLKQEKQLCNKEEMRMMPWLPQASP